MAPVAIQTTATSSHFQNGYPDDHKREARQTAEKSFGLELHRTVLIYVALTHLNTVFFIYLVSTGRIPWGLILFHYVYSRVAGLGITVEAHRYWTHKTFKANFPLQVALMLMQTAAVQNSIYKWSLDHRLHHKYMDTELDPHNSKRGFWFSHITWLFQPGDPKLVEKRRAFDMPDLERDPVVMFQHRWYVPLALIMEIGMPVGITYYFWGDLTPFSHILSANFARWVFLLHVSASVNSLAHMWGMRPYDQRISPTDNKLVAVLSGGEGWHNYHHSFPWDYRASEWGWKINPSTMFIDFFAWMGWAYELKTVSPEMIRERKKRTGKWEGDEMDSNVWGWGDEKMSPEARNVTQILNRRHY